MRVEILIVAMLGLVACTSDEIRFSEHTVSTGPLPCSVSVADFDRDGVLDLVVQSWDKSGLHLSRGHGDGTFEDPVALVLEWNDPYFFWPASVVAGDFDGDGWTDLAVEGDCWSDPTTHRNGCERGIIWRNVGNGSFGPIEPLDVEGFAVQAGDFNGDRRDEVVILARNGDGAMIRSSENVVPRLAVDLPTYGALTAAPADFDQDGVLDLVVSSGSSCNITYSPADAEKTSTRGFGTVPEPVSLAVGDFNRDGLPDLAAVSFFGGSPVSVYLNDGRGAFASSGDYPNAEESARVATGDFDGDGILDLAVVDYDYRYGWAGRLRVFTGTGDGSFTLNRTIAVGNSVFVTVADLDADGKSDLVVGADLPSTLTVLLSR